MNHRHHHRSGAVLGASLTVVAALILAGCGGGSGGGSSSTPATPATVSGSAAKGPIGGATVNVYAMNANGSRGGLVAGPFTTAADGSWSGTLPVGAAGPFVVVASGGSYTDEATNATVTLAAADELESLIASAPAGGTVTAAITPYTHALALAAAKMANDGTAVTTAVNNAISTATTQFGFNPVAVMPVDPLNHPPAATADQKKYAALLGGISTLGQNAAITGAAPSATPIQVAVAVAQDMADGRLDGLGLNGSPVSLPNGLAPVNLPALSATDLSQLNTAVSSFTGAHAGAYAGVTPPTLSGGVYTPPAATAPDAPAGVAAVANSASQITVNWNAVTGATGYDVYRANTTGQTITAMTKLTASPVNATTYANTGLNANTTYYYRVVAVNAAGPGSPSVEVSATTQASGGIPGLMGGTIQGNPFPMSQDSVTTFAGTKWDIMGSTDGIGANALFNGPQGVAFNGGDLYIADSQNKTIRKMVLATGAVTTLAGSPGTTGSTDGIGALAKFGLPYGMVSVGGDLFVVDQLNHKVRKVTVATGAVTTLAGSYGSADGTGAAAGFNFPAGIASDGTRLFVADRSNHTIRQIDIATGAVTTLAGTAGSSGSTDGTGAAARFFSPLGIATDGTNLYVADSNNHVIRQIVIATGAVTTLAGTTGVSGVTDGTGTAAKFYAPRAIFRDGGNLYVVDWYTVRKIDIATGAVTTLAGMLNGVGYKDGIGSQAWFSQPLGLTSDGANLYIADTGNHLVRKLEIASATSSTLAGGNWHHGNGIGAAARFYQPEKITTDGTNLYVADTSNHTIRKIVIATGEATVLAGSPGIFGDVDGVGATARFVSPRGITTDGANLYVTSYWKVRKIVIATGEVTTLAGSTPYGTSDGIGAAAGFYNPGAITTDGVNLYVADNYAIRKVAIANGQVSTLAGSITLQGTVDGSGTAARFTQIRDLTTDGANLYAIDGTNLRKLVLSSAGVSTLVALNAYGYGANGITTDGTYLYIIADNLRRYDLAGGTLSLPIVGLVGGYTDSTYTMSQFSAARGITYSGTALFVSDTGNNVIRKIQ